MATINFGRLGINPRGNWSNGVSDYRFLDMMYYEGATPDISGSYIVRIQNGFVPAGTLPTNTTYFLQITKNGEKGDAFTYADFTPEQLALLKGDAFTYDDFTPEQIEDLQRPALDAAQSANQAAQEATTAKDEANTATQSANQATQGAITAKDDANQAAQDAIDAADTANAARGWTPDTELEIYNGKIIKKLVGYIGGTGDAPTAHVGEFYMIGGFTTDKNEATDYKGERGNDFEPDMWGAAADRALYDGEPRGFAYLDEENNLLYFKNSIVSGDWSMGLDFGRGADGYTPEIGINGNWWINGVDTGKPTKGSDANVTKANIESALGYTPEPSVAGKGLSEQNYTLGEKQKLAGLESSKFKGQFTTYAQLVAEAEIEIGAYAYVDGGVGSVVAKYIWDSSDEKWELVQGATTEETPASIKSKYESNPDTNALTNVRRDAVDGLPTNYLGINATAKNSEKWNGQEYDTPTDNISMYMLGYTEAGKWGAYPKYRINTFLGMPTGGDTLQSVTDRGEYTSKNVQIGGVLRIDHVINFGQAPSEDAYLRLIPDTREITFTNGNFSNPNWGSMAFRTGNIYGMTRVISPILGLMYQDGETYQTISPTSDEYGMLYKNKVTASLQLVTHSFGGFENDDDVTFDGLGNIRARGDMYSGGIKVSTIPTQSTGTSIQFDKERIYGSPSAPITGNLTTNTTGATAGITAKVFHSQGSVPTFPATWKRATGSMLYSTTKVNRIYAQYEDANNIIYTITYD